MYELESTELAWRTVNCSGQCRALLGSNRFWALPK